MYRPPKNFTQSLTVWLNLAMTVVFAILALGQTEEFGALVALLPLKVQAGVTATIGLLAAIANIYVRVTRTRSPVLPPKIGKGAAILLILALSGAAASCVSTRDAAGVADRLPAADQIASPAYAEAHLYMAVKTYQLAVGSVNALKDAGVKLDYARLVSDQDSVARRCQRLLQAATIGLRIWVAGGSRNGFDAAWREALPLITELQSGGVS